MLFIAGPHGAGKTHSAGVLGNLGFTSLDLGPYLRSIWRSQSPHSNFADYLRDKVAIHGQNFTDDLIVDKINRKLIEIARDESLLDLLIVGNRSLGGIQYIKDHSVENNKPQPIIYIESDENSLYQRYCLKEGREIPLEEFRKILGEDSSIGLETIREGADFRVDNNGSMQEFESTVLDVVFNKIGYKERI